MLINLGDWGWQTGAVGLVVFTVLFLIVTRWWASFFGKLVAGVLTMISLVLTMSVLRMLDVSLPGGVGIWRVVIYWGFAIAVWTGVAAFLWAQFFAPRVRQSGGRITTRREFRNEQEADLADRGDSGDGGLHDRSGLPH